jgi:hypothetical protein
VLLIVFCIGVIALLAFLHESRHSPVTQLVARLPQGDALTIYVDAEALRDSGLLNLLAGSSTGEESEYREFVEESGFNYTTDLDSALVSFHENETFFLLRGRFDWDRLVDFVTNRNGSCHNGFCRVRGSGPDRRISFFAVTPRVMAMAVSRDAWAASALASPNRDPVLEEIPEQPVWLTVSGPVLSRSDWLPAGARSFASAVVQAEQLVLGISPSGTAFEAQLSIDCPTASQAAQLAGDLERTTETLRGLIASEDRSPNPGDLTGVLTAGSFRHQDRRVYGRWPIQREFLEVLASGSP